MLMKSMTKQKLADKAGVSLLPLPCHLDQALARGALGSAAWLVQEIS